MDGSFGEGALREQGMEEGVRGEEEEGVGGGEDEYARGGELVINLGLPKTGSTSLHRCF